MGLPGKLTKDKFGFSMPVDSPLYGRLPVLYKDVSMLIYEYVTSADAAAALLPAACCCAVTRGRMPSRFWT